MKRKKRVFWILLCLVFLLPFKAQAWGIKGSWDANTEPDLAGYNIFIATTHAKASQKIGDIAEFSTEDTWFCYEETGGIPDVIFGAITAYDTEGRENGVSNIYYLLAGNVWGTCEDGVFYTEARVDGLDITTMGIYFGLKNIVHQELDCAEGFSIDNTSIDQRCDIDHSGEVKGRDLIEMCLRYNNRANQNES